MNDTFHERKAGITADFIHCPCLWCYPCWSIPSTTLWTVFFVAQISEDGYDGIIVGLPGSKFYQCCRNWIWRWINAVIAFYLGAGGS